MKILSLHCDYIKFKAKKKALKKVQETDKEEKEVKEPAVFFIAAEKQDESNPEIISQLIDNIKDISKKLNIKNIVLYPYAHLSPNLSKPDFAEKLLKDTEKQLKKSKFKVTKAPFGYYKEFELKCKGHPLAELSREINYEGEVKEEKIDYKKLLKEISKSKLDTSKLKPSDHRILGKQMNLFSFSETAPGMVFWHNNGLIIYNKLIEFMREFLRKESYQEIKTPEILNEKLWKISGHWNKYKENIFLTNYENKNFAVKPMNCPGHLLIYKNSPKSYKDLPLKSAEFGTVHRQELSGVLGGLFRTIQFTQDDAHVFCTDKQLQEEIIKIIDLTNEVYKTFNFDYSIELSTRPEKRIGSDEIWDKAEKALEKALKKKKIKYKLNKGDGAFYGPKIDFHIKDSLNRTWQCGTIQLDFSMPERFGLKYTDKDNKEKIPIMLHRAIFGSLERFIGVLLEHTKGRLPIWLAPKQARVINYTDRNNKAVQEFSEKLKQNNIRVDTDLTQEPLSGKIKQAEVEKVPYIIVIGDKEEKSGEVAVRNQGKVNNMKQQDFINKILKEKP